MYIRRNGLLTSLLFVILIFPLVCVGCDDYQIITFDNQTENPIQVDIKSVPLDYQDTPAFDYPQDDVIQASESKKYVAPVWDDRTIGSERKYPVEAVNIEGEVVFYRVFTWDELRDMGWRIIIETQE